MKDPSFVKLFSEFIDILNTQLVYLNQEDRARILNTKQIGKTLQGYATEHHKIQLSTITNLLSIMKEPTKSEVVKSEDTNLVEHILSPSNEILRMIQYYKNVLEIQMLSNDNAINFDKTVTEFIEHRANYVKLHPYYPQIEADESLKELFWNQFGIKIKEELEILHSQSAPFGSYLAIKHLLPESYEGFANEEWFLNSLKAPAMRRRRDPVILEYKKMKKNIDRKRTGVFFSIYDRAVSSWYFDAVVPKVGYKKPKPNIDPRVADLQTQLRYLQEPLRAEKRVGDSWNPKRDSPSVPKDDLEKKLPTLNHIDSKNSIVIEQKL